MRGGVPVVRGGLVIDVADSYPFEFPQGSSEAKVEGGLVIFCQMVPRSTCSVFIGQTDLAYTERQHIP